MELNIKLFLSILLIIFHLQSFAQEVACFDKKKTLSLDNDRAITLKESQNYGFKTRLFLTGTIIQMTENRQGHVHYEVDLDSNLSTINDRIEAIFNSQYGELPQIIGGEKVILCGDFILDQYSPFKAVIHWLHKSPNVKKHDHGFMIINEEVFGL